VVPTDFSQLHFLVQSVSLHITVAAGSCSSLCEHLVAEVPDIFFNIVLFLINGHSQFNKIMFAIENMKTP